MGIIERYYIECSFIHRIRKQLDIIEWSCNVEIKSYIQGFIFKEVYLTIKGDYANVKKAVKKLDLLTND